MVDADGFLKGQKSLLGQADVAKAIEFLLDFGGDHAGGLQEQPLVAGMIENRYPMQQFAKHGVALLLLGFLGRRRCRIVHETDVKGIIVREIPFPQVRSGLIGFTDVKVDVSEKDQLHELQFLVETPLDQSLRRGLQQKPQPSGDLGVVQAIPLPSFHVEKVLPLPVGRQLDDRQGILEADVVNQKVQIGLRERVDQCRRLRMVEDCGQGIFGRHGENPLPALGQLLDALGMGPFRGIGGIHRVFYLLVRDVRVDGCGFTISRTFKKNKPCQGGSGMLAAADTQQQQ
nr:hypothetical protein [Desulfosarcina cetonica]